MELGHSFDFASGPERRICHCLAYRFDASTGFRPDAGESHVLEWDDDRVHDRMWKAGWFTCLWRSPTGVAYVTDSAGELHVVPPHAESTKWRTYPMAGGLPMGVWGLDDANVWVWGRKSGEGFVLRFDGSRFTELPSPGKVLWIHGLAPDFLVAAGEDGLVAHWNGDAWTAGSPVSGALLSSVHVASPDEMYACGKGGEIWSSTGDGWQLRYRHDAPLGFIAKWDDRIWLAAGGDHGLSELVGDRLESRKPNLTSTYLDVRHDLLISCPNMIAATTDGERYKGKKVDAFAELVASINPDW